MHLNNWTWKAATLLSLFTSVYPLDYRAAAAEDFQFNTDSRHLRPVFERRQANSDGPGYLRGQPNDGKGKGGVFSGGTNNAVDLQNPSNLGGQSTDSGSVVNLKWSFSNSRSRLVKGGWVREQVISDLPASHDIAGAQFHLNKGSIREFHWHTVAEWGYVYQGRVSIAGVDEIGRNQFEILEVGDVWYFPKGEGHAIQGLDENNEFLLAFDDGNFAAPGRTFHLDDWIAKTPKHILAKNFGVNASVFDKIPVPNPYIVSTEVNTENIDHPFGELQGNLSWVYHASKVPATVAPGGGGTIKTIDSTNFPVAKTIAATIVELKPGGLRELHWHPNAEEWLYFHRGTARATVYVGNANARTFDFRAGDTAVFPDNSGHYIENTGNETLVWVELYKADRVQDVSLTQWLALTPAPIAAAVLGVPVEVVRTLKKEKQVLIA